MNELNFINLQDDLRRLLDVVIEIKKHIESIHATIYFLVVSLGVIFVWLIIYNVLRRYF